MTQLSRRAEAAASGITCAIPATAKAMRAKGKVVLNFSAGTPDFDVPDAINEAVIRAIRAGAATNTAARTPAVAKAAIAENYRRELGLAFTPAEILVSDSGKHALHSILKALLNPGDEVIIPAPYWLLYPDMVRLSGGLPVTLPTRCSDDYKISPWALETALSPRTAALILNSPTNPDGAIYSAGELRGLAAILERRNTVVIVDDVFKEFAGDGGTMINILTVAPGLRDRVVIINSASRSDAIPGCRLAHAVGPSAIIGAASAIRGRAGASGGSIPQKTQAVVPSTGDSSVDTPQNDRREINQDLHDE